MKMKRAKHVDVTFTIIIERAHAMPTLRWWWAMLMRRDARYDKDMRRDAMQERYATRWCWWWAMMSEMLTAKMRWASECYATMMPMLRLRCCLDELRCFTTMTWQNIRCAASDMMSRRCRRDIRDAITAMLCIMRWWCRERMSAMRDDDGVITPMRDVVYIMLVTTLLTRAMNSDAIRAMRH